MAAAQPIITETELAPLTDAPSDVWAPAQAAAEPVVEAPVQLAAAPPSAYRVQAGAFSDRANAERVANELADTGVVVIQPIDRDGMTLYRVMVSDIPGASQANVIRDKVMQIGLVDAQILYPF